MRTLIAALAFSCLTAVAVAGPINTTCPVSGKALESDTAVFTYQGHEIGICCPKCDAKFMEWPQEKRDAYLLDALAPVNDVCPITGNPVESEAKAILYNGFKVAFCCPKCDEKFAAMTTREKDAFIGKFVKPVNTVCPVSDKVVEAEDAMFVTHDGVLFQFCCKMCLKDWEKADAAGKEEIFASVVALKTDAADMNEMFEGAASLKTDAAVNDVCPITGNPIVDDGGFTLHKGKKVGFCCPKCDKGFNAMSDEKKDAFVAGFASKDASRQAEKEANDAQNDNDAMGNGAG